MSRDRHFFHSFLPAASFFVRGFAALLIFAAFSGLGVLTASEPDPPFVEFWRDDFTSMKRKAFSSGEIKRIRARPGNAAHLDAALLPEHWFISIDTYPADGLMERVEGAPGMKVSASSDPLMLRTRKFAVENYAYRFTLRKSGSGSVSVTPELFDAAASAGQRLTPAVFEPGRDVLTVDVPAAENAESVRFHLQITGEVVLLEANLMRRAVPGVTICEGTITARSVLPDPAASDYPDCNYTADCELQGIVQGEITPRNIRLILPGFRKNSYTAEASLKAGDKVRLRIMPVDSPLFPGDAAIQEADTIPFGTDEVYRTTLVSRLTQFSDFNSIAPFSKQGKYESVFDRPVNPGLTAAELSAKKAAIASELARVKPMTEGLTEAKIAEWNKKFDAAWSKRAAELPVIDSGRQIVWGRAGHSFWALPLSHSFSVDTRMEPYNVAAVKSFDDLLAKNGIRLVIQGIPHFSSVAARVLVPEFRDVPDHRSAMVVRQLLESGVEALYTADRMIRSSDQYPLSFFYPVNAHPHDGAQEVLTEQMAEYLKREFPELVKREAVDPNRFSMTMAPTVYGDQYRWPEGVDIGENKAGGENLCETILYDEKPFRVNPASPLYIVGNSVIQTPMRDHAYVSRLGRKLALVPDSTRISGASPFLTFSRYFFQNPERYMKGKKVVVIPVYVNYLTQGVHFLDLHELDRFSTALSGLEIKKILTFPGTIPSNAISKIPEMLQWDLWRDFFGQACACVRIETPGGVVPMTPIEIPWGDLDLTKPIVGCFQTQACCRPDADASMTVNGAVYQIPVSNYLQPPEWQYVIVKIPPGVKSLNWTVQSPAEGSIIVFRSLSLYQ